MAMSRQFSFTRALGKARARPEETSNRPKIIIAGNDVTPLPLSTEGFDFSLSLNDIPVALPNDNETDTQFSIEATTDAICANEGCLLDVSEGKPTYNTSQDDTVNPLASCDEATDIKIRIKHQATSAVLALDALSKSVKMMELAVCQNLHLKTQLRYLNLPIDDNGAPKNTKPNIELLFEYSCSESQGRPITSMSWTTNGTGGNLLAVGYGESNVSPTATSRKDGRIMLWSIRNPSYPEAIFKTSAEVQSLDFSTLHPSYLAAGLSGGRIVIHDTSNPTSDALVADSKFVRGRHTSLVWQVKWIQPIENGGDEVLVSKSIDGDKLEWTPNLTLRVPSATFDSGSNDTTNTSTSCMPDRYLQHQATCPSSETVSALINVQGDLELWDTSRSKTEAIIIDAKDNRKRSIVIFGGSDGNILVAGSECGIVEVFKMHI